MKKKLWTKDFSCITVATVLSAIGGEAMNLPVSLLVFDETNSTFLSALVMICGMMPDVLFPVLVAPLIDKGGKKNWIEVTCNEVSAFKTELFNRFTHQGVRCYYKTFVIHIPFITQ